MGQGLGSRGFSEIPASGDPEGAAAEPLPWGLQTTRVGLPSEEDICSLQLDALWPHLHCIILRPVQGHLDRGEGPSALGMEHLHALLGLWSLKLRCLVMGLSVMVTLSPTPIQPLSQEAQVQSFSCDSDPPVLFFRRSAPIPTREDFIFKEVILGEPQLLHLKGEEEPHLFVKELRAGALGIPLLHVVPQAVGMGKPALSTSALKLPRDQRGWSGEAGPFHFQNAAIPPDPPSVSSSSIHPFSEQEVIPSCVPAEPTLGPLV